MPAKAITNDDADHILMCLRVLSERSPAVVNIFNERCRTALSTMLNAKTEEEESTQKTKEKASSFVQADDPISFVQLTAGRGGDISGENVFEMSLSQVCTCLSIWYVSAHVQIHFSDSSTLVWNLIDSCFN